MGEPSKLQVLLDLEGFYDSSEFGEKFIQEGVVPGICMNYDCDFTAWYEPDQDRGFCEECGTQTVRSGLILMGVM